MLLISEIAIICQVPESRVRYWERRGIIAGSPGYERLVQLEARTLDALFTFLRAAWTHPSIRDVPYEVIAAAFRAADERVPARFLAPPRRWPDGDRAA